MIDLRNDFSQKVDILTASQRGFLSTYREKATVADFDYLHLRATSKEDYTIPNALVLRWEENVLATVLLSEREDFQDSLSYTGNGVCELDNLKSATRYYLHVIDERDGSVSAYSFETDYAPIRFIRVDGITNVRDVGGRKTQDGRTVKQGFLYRGAEMNSHLTITEKGLETLRRVCKIKTVLDLRRETEIVEDVYKGAYQNVPCYAYVDIFDHPQSIRDIFRLLATPDAYPIYFHCWGGADRTGTIAFLLGALLGEELVALFDDYEITTLSIWGARSRNLPTFQLFLEKLNAFEGKTLAQKTEQYLQSVGVSMAEIQRIKEIFLAE